MSADEHLSHFFLLPRELRDSIYGYLSHDIEFQWRWNYWPFSGRDGMATVRLRNIPCVNALLTGMQFCYEYLAAWPTTLDVILGRGDAYSQENDPFHGLIDELLPRINRLNIMIYIRSPNDGISPHFWFEAYLLSRVLRDRAPQMKSLQITAFTPPPEHPEARIGHSKNHLPQAFFSPPHDLLNSFSPTRHAHQYCLVSGDDHHVALSHPGIIPRANAAGYSGWILLGKWLYTRAHDQGSSGA